MSEIQPSIQERTQDNVQEQQEQNNNDTSSTEAKKYYSSASFDNYRDLARLIRRAARIGSLEKDQAGNLLHQLDIDSKKSIGIEVSKIPEGVDEKKGFSYIRGILDTIGWDSIVHGDSTDKDAFENAAQGMCGLDTDEAWQLREEIYSKTCQTSLGRSMFGTKISQGLAGVDSEKAWQMREKLDPEGKGGWYTAESLAGLDSEVAWQMRKQLEEKHIHHSYIFASTAGLDNDRAWELRVRLIQIALRDTEIDTRIGFALSGLDSEQAWEFREKYFAQRPILMLASITGLDTERAWAVRESMKNNSYTVITLAGVDSEQAWQIRRQKLAENDSLFLGHSLAGLDSEEAWGMRNSLVKSGNVHEAVESVFGCYYVNPRIIFANS